MSMIMNELTPEDSSSFDKRLDERIQQLADMFRRNEDGLDIGALESSTDPTKRITHLPDFDELFKLKKHPEQLYQKSIALKVDRNTIEEKILTPLRRAIACAIDFRSVVNYGHRMIKRDEDVAKGRQELMNDTLTDLMAYMAVLQVNILKYEGRQAMKDLGRE